MNGSCRLKAGLGIGLVVVSATTFVLVSGSCGTAPAPFIVSGPGRTGNEPPILEIEEPNTNVTRDQGGFFLIRWRDTDRDSNALISFALVNTVTNDVISLVDGIYEDDLVGPDQFSVGTSLVPIGTYNIRGVIDDGENEPTEVYAMTTAEAVEQRVVVTIVDPGGGPPTVPPVVTVTRPGFNQSVAQDDVLTVVVQPTELAPAAADPFDPDSSITLYLLLDLDLDPNNDDPANPDSEEIILLREQTIESGSFEAVTFDISIDLATIPALPGGAPYYIRATADDGTNPRVHQYAVGTISVVQLAAGEVDLADIGKSKSGARFLGFSPGANLGSSVSHIGDFDADGVDDFALVAQYGNPRNVGQVGEAYIIYGQDGIRFGGTLGVNEISEAVDGVLIEAPPIRMDTDECVIPGDARSDGITDVSFIRDLSGDGRPELLFGCPHVHGAFDSTDYDPGDQDISSSDNTMDIVVVIRQGQVTLQEGDAAARTTSQTYNGVEDLTIDSAAPNTVNGSAIDIVWQDSGAGNRKWGLIKIRNILDYIPDDAFTIDITSVSARLSLRVFNTGGPGDVYQCETDFNEQTTFSSFALGGGEPQQGVDYDPSGAGAFGTIEGGSPEVTSVDVTTLVQELIDLQFLGYDDDLMLIFVPNEEEGADDTAVRSSEFSIEGDRPTLTIEYTRRNLVGSSGCYPDDIVNNFTDDDAGDRQELQFYAGGMVVLLDSGNRDNDPRQSPVPDRLETTSVALELIGQEGWVLDVGGINELGGSIFARADNYQQDGRLAGARFIAGPFDCVDHRLLNQPARDGLFGTNVAAIGDLNNDGVDEIVISAPRNELYYQLLFETYGYQSTHWHSTQFTGSIAVIPGHDYNNQFWRDTNSAEDSTASIPILDQHRQPPFGRCQAPTPRHQLIPADSFSVLAEDVEDMLGGATSAGDFNQDGLDDILCGAPLNDRSEDLRDTGAVYVLYGRNVLSDFDLKDADDSLRRTPMLRIRGVSPGDQIGWRQATGLDVNGDRIDDVFIASPHTDYGGVPRSTCAGDYTRDGTIDDSDLSLTSFNSCKAEHEDHVYTDDACKVFDYNNDEVIDGKDEEVFFCLSDGGGNECCDNLVDNGFVAVVFGGVFTDGDRTIDQIATPDLPGAVFYGASAGHRAGVDVSSAGDFNQDGFGDILIAVPGEVRLDRANRLRLGTVYLVFGGTHLYNTKWSLDQLGSEDLPGIVFLSPYVKGRPNEAAPTTIAYIGDINHDGFGDICIGNPLADFIDLSYPQGPNATDAELGRRRDAGDAYIVYGNNFGSNRSTP